MEDLDTLNDLLEDYRGSLYCRRVNSKAGEDAARVGEDIDELNRIQKLFKD